ncbi:hypothetical protein C0995_010294 [Termitomyces sp. Mi166|nr:hypothetical protein C0995_010294 [Termitomyces sp. Mi166\
MVQYRIPNLLTHLQPYIKPNNPNYDALKAEHVAWIDSSCFFNDENKKAWRHAEMPLLASRAFPKSSLGPLRVCLEYMVVSLLLEQLTDGPTTTAQAQKWKDIFKQAFKQTLKETQEPAEVIIKQLFTYGVLKAIKDPYRQCLIENNILLAEGMVKEAADRENPNTEHTLESYMKARRDTIGIRPMFVIGRWIHGLDIGHEVLMHPDIVKIEDGFVDLVFLANDLYSYKKEFFECGAHHNYVTISLRDPITGLHEKDRQGALDHTCQKFFEILVDLQHRKKALPSFGESEDSKVAMYVDLMMDVVVANIQWSLACKRYDLRIAGTAEAPKWGDVAFDMDPL